MLYSFYHAQEDNLSMQGRVSIGSITPASIFIISGSTLNLEPHLEVSDINPA